MPLPRYDLALSLLVCAAAGLSAPGFAASPSYALHPALEMTLFAAEPDVVDAVALTFDEDGRLYVVEMRDYPLGIGPEGKPGGTIRLLEDENGDGKIDRATMFAEGLSFPTSAVPWNGGVLVTAPPEIIFLKDTDGDRKADHREILFRGFTLGVTDSNVNGLRWGLDNRVHGVNGGNGGRITSTRAPGAPVPLQNLDFSFAPGTGDFTTTYETSGGFGLVFDEWGRSFSTYNIDHIQHRVLPVRYLNRFPGLPPIRSTANISDHGDMARIYPISVPETRVNHPEQSGHFSSAGGMGYIGWITDSPYPNDLPGSILVGDVVGNLVHRDVLIEDGPSFIARRSPAELKSEFLASRDNVFRPVGIELGPDGALYLIDMQRAVIEHPDYIPQKVKDKLVLRAGEDRGRIYRIAPKGGLAFQRPNLGRASTAELVRALGHPNPWWRLTAQRLLVERRDKTAAPSLNAASESRTPLERLHALWTLHGLGALEAAGILHGLADPHAGIREHSLRLAEAHRPDSNVLLQKILSLAADPSPRVRFQTALTLGQWEHPIATRYALLQILLRDHAYAWTRLAVLSSIRDGADKLFQSLLAEESFRSSLAKSKIELARELADLIAARSEREGPRTISSVLTTLLNIRAAEEFQLATLEGLQAGFARSAAFPPADSATTAALTQLSSNGTPAVLAAAWKLSRTLGVAESEAQRLALRQTLQRMRVPGRPETLRLEDLKLFALGHYSAVAETLFALLAGTESTAIQMGALEVLRQFNEPEMANALIDRWPGLAPAVRTGVINLLLQRRVFHEALMAAVENDKLKLGELNLDLEQRRLLLRQSSPAIQARAAKWFGDEEYSHRKAVVEEWLNKLPAQGIAERGRVQFEKICAPCHVAGGLGAHVGPDLSDVSHRSVEDLLSNILDPNMAINPSYTAYGVELDSGELETGILESESAEAITLLQAQGKKLVLARRKIKSLQSTGVSLMPEGLEAGMTPADLRDLIGYLQQPK